MFSTSSLWCSPCTSFSSGRTSLSSDSTSTFSSGSTLLSSPSGKPSRVVLGGVGFRAGSTATRSWYSSSLGVSSLFDSGHLDSAFRSLCVVGGAGRSASGCEFSTVGSRREGVGFGTGPCSFLLCFQTPLRTLDYLDLFVQLQHGYRFPRMIEVFLPPPPPLLLKFRTSTRSPGCKIELRTKRSYVSLNLTAFSLIFLPASW